MSQVFALRSTGNPFLMAFLVSRRSYRSPCRSHQGLPSLLKSCQDPCRFLTGEAALNPSLQSGGGRAGCTKTTWSAKSFPQPRGLDLATAHCRGPGLRHVTLWLKGCGQESGQSTEILKSRSLLANEYQVIILQLFSREPKNFSVAKASKKDLLQRARNIFTCKSIRSFLNITPIPQKANNEIKWCGNYGLINQKDLLCNL